MIKVRFAVFILVLFAINTYSQTNLQTIEQNKPQIYKFDEYEKIAHRKLESRLRIFVIKMLKTCATANIVVYAPK